MPTIGLGPQIDPMAVLRAIKAGDYLAPPVPPSTSSRPNGTCTLHPLILTQLTTLDQILCETTIAGASGSLTRLGIYASGTNGHPGALILDAGTVDTAAVASVKSISINQQLAAGIYWLAGVAQGGVTVPTYRVTLGSLPWIGGESSTTAFTVAMCGYFKTGVTGALPPTMVDAGATNTAIRIVVRTA